MVRVFCLSTYHYFQKWIILLVFILLYLLCSGYAVPHEWVGTLDATATDVVKVRSSVMLCAVQY